MTKKTFKFVYSCRRIYILILICILTNSCSNEFDIKKAQDFGKKAKSFDESYVDIVKDIYKSCLRNARYSGKIQKKEPLDITRTQLEESCVAYASTENYLLESHKVISKYTNSFNTLSSDELINNLNGAGNLAESIVNLPIPAINEAQKLFPISRIAKALATSIQRALAEQKRNRVLKKSILNVNKDIQVYIATLGRVTELIYTNQLNSEQSSMRSYYAPIISQELDKSNVQRQLSPTQVSVILADKLWQQDRDSINYPEKFYKVHSYLMTLKDMAKLHQDLYSSISKFDK
jgi:hypothetical protein